jgi:hypothetical protein
MFLSRILLATATAALLATSAYAETPAEAATHMPPPAENGAGMGGHGGLHRFLSDNQRMMFMVDMHKATASMTDDQKQAYREQQRARIMAMSEGDRAKFKADLDTRWAALPADQKAQITAMVQARMAAHAGGATPQ